jgi:hypothetical protein
MIHLRVLTHPALTIPIFDTIFHIHEVFLIENAGEFAFLLEFCMEAGVPTS